MPMTSRSDAVTAVVVAFGLAAGLTLHAGVRAQEQRSPTLLTTDHYIDLERVSDAQIAPDGTQIIYTRQHVNKLEDKWDSELWIVNADGSQNRFLVEGRRRALVARRQAHCCTSPTASRRARRSSCGGWTPKGRRRRSRTSPRRRARRAGRPTASRSGSRCSSPTRTT